MLQNSPVPTVSTDREVMPRAAFKAIESAVRGAYEDTDQLCKQAGFHPRVIKAGFGQLLFYAVMNRLNLLNDVHYPFVKVSLLPNGAYGSLHVCITIDDDWFITVSAVPDIDVLPRDAKHRDHYAQQWTFAPDANNNFVPVPPPGYPVRVDGPTYIHLLHGPRENNRRRLGFILVAQPDAKGEYISKPIPLETFLNDRYGPVTSDEETITDTIKATIKIKETHKEV